MNLQLKCLLLLSLIVLCNCVSGFTKVSPGSDYVVYSTKLRLDQYTGKVFKRYNDQRLEWKGFLKSGLHHGEFVYYHNTRENRRKQQGKYERDYKTGVWTTYFADGKTVKEVGSYRVMPYKTSTMSRKVGKWESFYGAGKPESVSIFNDDASPKGDP